MDTEQEKQAIKSANTVWLILDGVRIRISKSNAMQLLFDCEGYVIDTIKNTYIEIAKLPPR